MFEKYQGSGMGHKAKIKGSQPWCYVNVCEPQNIHILKMNSALCTDQVTSKTCGQMKNITIV